MPTSPPSSPREFALEVVRRLREKGFEALWAGGCVRDQLLGRSPKDYDVATNATPDEVRNLFGHRKTLAIGESFGVITVLGPRDVSGHDISGHDISKTVGQIEVATFRTDAAYSDGRHPDQIHFSTAEEDAQRRDFTINGLFFDPIGETVIDYVAGQRDLAAKLIRAIGDPAHRIAEDKLRMLRAVRFAATLEFVIEPATLTAVQQSAGEITQVSAERIGMELRRMLVDTHRSRAMTLLSESQLLAHVLPEVATLEPTAWKETLQVFERLPACELPLALAALLHRADGERIGRKVGKRLRFSNKEIERADWLLDKLPVVRNAASVSASVSWPMLQRVLVHEGGADLISLLRAVVGEGAEDGDSSLQHCEERLALPIEKLNPEPLINGAALIAHGLTPGPGFATVLEAVRDAQLEGTIATQHEALALAERMMGES